MPAKILEEAGINIRDPKFWQGGFDVLEKLVSELEKMPVGGKKKGKVKSAALTSEAVSKDKKAVVKKAKPVKGKAKKK